MKKCCSMLLIFFLLTLTLQPAFPQSIQHPNEYFGLTLGADRTLINYDQLVQYFQYLSENSANVLVENLGLTTERNPFILAYISSEKNVNQLDLLRSIQQKLADPRQVEEQALPQLLNRGKSIISVNCSIHSTEIGASQMAPLLAYQMATDTLRFIQDILDNVVLLLLPCHNPDGMNKVVDWYQRYLGTKYEGSRMPWLYHKYTGHDINRDWYMLTQSETRLTVEKIYNVWHPFVTLDMHQMGGRGARLFVPPYVNPIDPNIDPVLISQINMLGHTIVADLTAKGKSGIITNVSFDAWSPSRTYIHYHGGIRILSEMASCRIASPIENISETSRSRTMKRSWNLPKPWDESSWHLSDIVDYDKDIVLSILNHAAKYRLSWLQNFHTVGLNAVNDISCFAFVIPAGQWDDAMTFELLEVLNRGQVEIFQATENFKAGGKSYKKGSYIIYNAQPYGAFARTLLDVQKYSWEENARAYDVVGHTLPFVMGVKADKILNSFHANALRVKALQLPEGEVRSPDAKLFLCNYRSTYSVKAVNRMLHDDIPVYWLTEPVKAGDRIFPKGSIVVEPEGKFKRFSDITEGLGLKFYGSQIEKKQLSMRKIQPYKAGLYKSWRASMNEGWLRFVLEEYDFNFKSIFDDDIRKGEFADNYDVLIVPDLSEKAILNGHRTEYMPEEYCGGIGEQGLQNLKKFVNNGGTLVLVGNSVHLGLNNYQLPVSYYNANKAEGFRVGGSILEIELDTDSPVCYGMQENAGFLFQQRYPLFDTEGKYSVGKFPEKDLLLSGGILGEQALANKVLIANVPVGKGRIILFGFRPYFRAQTRGTYKLIFNSIFLSNLE